jgi:hypothetical protein
MWYMGIDADSKPNGWDTVPWGGILPGQDVSNSGIIWKVTDAVRAIHEAHPDYRWNGTALVEYVPPTPPEPEPVIPTSLTRRQAKLILLHYGLLDGVEGIVTTLPRAAQIEYADALYFERSNPLIQMVAQAASMTDAQVDEMFIAGNLL